MDDLNASRILKVQGGYNFRDLGGLNTLDGTTVKKGLLFRTDELNNLKPDDLELLAQLNVQTVVDFRTDQERAQSVDLVPTTCKHEIHLNILSANMDAFVAEIQKGTSDLKKLMLEFYKDLVLGANAIEEFIKFFQIIQQPTNTAIIYHCTAGKDRTGIATFLILEALNVSNEAIESDYLLSNEFLKDKYAVYINQNPKYADLFMVQSAYLNAAKDAIVEKYDTVQNYLTSVLKVDIALMKKIYTEG